MWTASFWLQALERAIKTFAQAAVALLTADGIGVAEIEWGGTAAAAGLAALVSILTSLAGAGVGAPDSPSLVPVTTPPRPASPDTIDDPVDA